MVSRTVQALVDVPTKGKQKSNNRNEGMIIIPERTRRRRKEGRRKKERKKDTIVYQNGFPFNSKMSVG